MGGEKDDWMGTKKRKQPLTVIDKYFTTNINIHYMIKPGM